MGQILKTSVRLEVKIFKNCNGILATRSRFWIFEFHIPGKKSRSRTFLICWVYNGATNDYTGWKRQTSVLSLSIKTETGDKRNLCKKHKTRTLPPPHFCEYYAHYSQNCLIAKSLFSLIVNLTDHSP